MKIAREALNRRLRKIRCLLLDVDGVLTDGKLQFTSDGAEIKTFDVLDGHGIAMAQRAGLTIGFISGRPSKATTQRAADLGVKIVLQKPVNKMEMVETVKRRHGFTNEEIGFIGDELVDLPALRRAGLAVAVANAVDEVKRAAHYITRHRGGDGAVREVIEMILKARGSWKIAIAKYLTVIAAALLLASPRLLADGDAKSARQGTNRTADTSQGYIEKFEVPERDDDGNLKWKLLGERAVIRPDGLMDIQDARAEFYTSNKVDMVFSSPTCLLDRANNHATTADHVRIDRENMVLTGIGGEWDGNTTSMVIRSNVCVVITNGQKNSGAFGKQP
ncbi:MAG TPA: HAD hydrolase family protein [Verrucomicrobiae bacterium]|nr:HAD hydrolase family protein [Verrucomicrobiae bacterium]